ncbi:serine/threonine-protein kinase-like protein CCR4 [Carex littledalei]|uniref:Serine/threonine-protein kinase-like protein CCR4 n=1 Tax=Carex littledalei TaxID=544730 RepID=A0A833RK13_9POAL|nr:serine/threonine-protein kinase-like protein CCR4 [Carex littledalei]
MPLYFSLILLLLISLSIPVSLSSPFSTLSISRLHKETIVCALVSSSFISSTAYDLTCISLPSGETINYSYESSGYGGNSFVQYSALATADDFLCGIQSPPNAKTSMLWWSFEGDPIDPWDNKRVYWGPPLLAISSGDSHVCGLKNESGGSIECWRWPELHIPDDISFKAIAVGGDFVCGITSCGGNIRCFGNKTDVVGREPPGSFIILAAGSHHACAVSTDLMLVCWGSGAPKVDPVPDDLVTLSLGTNITCILTSNGTVKCWGRGAAPPPIVAEKQFVSIEAKGDSVCGVIMGDFSVYCWGSKNFGNSTVYDQILPGTCAPETTCPCKIPGSANYCSDKGYVICQPCKTILRNSKIVIPPPPSASPASSPPIENKSKIKKVVMIAGITVGAALASCAVIVGFVLYKRAKKKEERRTDPDQTVEQPNRPIRGPLQPMVFTFRVLHDATDGFADSNKIGSGGFGTVYWGVLPDGRQAAFKRAHQRRRPHAESAFLSELGHLSRLNHINLVGLLGFCDERSERILVMEHMPHGNLYDQLHRLPPSDSSPLFTSWTNRLRIALDAARGIEYLHSYAVPGIIHRDIKSSNILLDETWTAKVSDFGLSMIRSNAGNGSSSAVSAGTVGYMDPEYYRLQELTEKSDVYSFGVVLLEMITGLKAVFKPGEDEEPCHVAEYVKPILNSGDTERLFDKRVTMKDGREEEAINTVAKLAAQCVRARGKSRPTMKEVVMELEWAVGLCVDSEDEMVEVVLEVEDRGSTMSTMSSMSTHHELE